MRRHPYLIAYLGLLALSTLLRVLFFALGERLPRSSEQRGTDGSPVVILADAGGDAVPRDRIAYALSGHHRLALVPDGIDPTSVVERSDGAPVHLVAFGTAGPLAIALAGRSPEHVRSLTLIDADGVEDFDLLGDHHLNRVLRHAQVVSTVAAEWLLPHFFTIDRALGAEAARAGRLLTQDRRRIRGELARWNGPTAIYVSPSARTRLATAREHARLLPQSSLGEWAIDSLPAFLARVEAGSAPTRGRADPARVAAAGRPFDAGGLASAQGVSLFVVLALLALTTLLSEDLACVAAGVLAARGSIPLWPAIVACYLGIVIGDQLLYLLGRSLGRAVLTRAPIRWWVSPADLERAYAWVDRQGMRVVLTSRFLPGTRFPVYVVAGALRAGFIRFALWLMMIGAVWTPALVGASYLAGRSGRDLVESLPGATWPWAVLGVILMTVGVRLAVQAVGRRQGAE